MRFLLTIAASFLMTTGVVHAQDAGTEDPPPAETETDDGDLPNQLVVDSSRRPIRDPALPDAVVPFSAERLSYWSRGEPRFFVSGRIDVGFLFLRPRFQFGYGRPHWSWLGFEINPTVSTNRIGGYFGAKADFPWVNFRIGSRYTFAFQQSFLTPQQSYNQHEIESLEGPSARYFSVEAQLELKVPLGWGDLRAEITGTYLPDVPDGYYVYENTLRLVAAPPWVWGVDAGYRISFGPRNVFFIQPSAEVVHVVERDEVIVRVGARVGAQPWPDLEARMVVMPTVYGTDELGDQGGNTFLIGIRYRFATDAPNFEEE